MKRIFKKLEKKDVFLIFCMFFSVILYTYLITNEHQKIKRWTYYVQYPFALNTIKCNKDAPDFMYDLMHETIKHQKSLNNQLAYYDGKKLHRCESGWENGFLGTRKITENSRFMYASISKVVTSALILDLINEKKLSLNDKLVNILDVKKTIDHRIGDITVEMLLQHSAGFDRYKTMAPMLTMGIKPWCPTHIDNLENLKLDFDPNTQFQYSNLGYCLLGVIVEKKSGLSFRKAAEQNYKLQARGIKFINSDYLPDEVNYDYRYEDFYEKFWRSKFDFKDSLSAVGGLSGSAKAMTLLAKDILSAKPYNILSRNSVPCSISLIYGCYGYAMDFYQPQGGYHTSYNKAGHFPGVETDIFITDDNRILTIFRGASTFDRSSLAEYRKNIYKKIENPK